MSLTVMVVLAALAIALVGGLSVLFPLLGLRIHQAAMRQRAVESAAAPLQGRLERSTGGLQLRLQPKAGAALPVVIEEWVWPPSLVEATGVLAPEACIASARAEGEPLRWRSAMAVDAAGLNLAIGARAAERGAGTLALLLRDATGKPARLWVDLPVRSA
ncbi:MAG: hypothetical protein MUE46_11190 [Xanthomonadales bacterium]|jgi:hypothetical protein|nr:hypothetical protein [Xanthomonadales bacterium]